MFLEYMQWNFHKSTSVFLGILSFFTASLMAHQTIGITSQALSRFSLKHREHKGMGYDQGYSTASLFLSPKRGGFGLSFVDARLHVFNNTDLASNVGIGSRFSDRDQTYLFGLNAYYDYRNTNSLATHQVSGGLEILSRRMDVRLNGYYPFVGTYQDNDILFSQFRGHSVLVKQKVRYALPCADAEIGFTLPDPFDEVGLYIGLGYYYLFKQEGFNRSAGNVSGGRARLTASPTDYISFGAEYTYDKLFGSRANGFIALNVPLGSARTLKKTSLKMPVSWVQLRTQDVVRNEIIPVVRKSHQFPHLNSEGTPLHFVFVNNKKLESDGIRGDGTFENPYTTLAKGSEKSSEGDIVYVFFGDGTSRGYDTGFDFKANQILTSSGVDLTLNGIRIPALTRDSLPLITNEKEVVIQASRAGQAMVNGFRIESVFANAIESRETALTLRRNNITAASEFSAVKTTGGIGISTFSDNDFYGNGGPAVIEIKEAQGVHKIDYNRITAQDGQRGVHIEDLDQSSYITNNIFDSNDPCGVAVSYEAITGGIHEYCNNTIEQGFYEGVHIVEGGGQFYIESNIFSSETLASGISYEGGSQQGIIAITDNLIQASQNCISIHDQEMAKTEIDISNNSLFSTSGSPSIVSEVSGSIDMNIEKNNIRYVKNLAGDFSAICCHFKGEEMQEKIVIIADNDIQMNSKNNGVSLKNSHNSNVSALIEGNRITTLDLSKGISVINKSSEGLYLSIINNKAVPGFTFSNQGSGSFEIDATTTSIKESNNPEGSYILKGGSLDWHSDESEE